MITSIDSPHVFIEAAIAGLNKYPCLRDFFGEKVGDWYAEAKKLGCGRLYTGRLTLPSMLATIHWLEENKASLFKYLMDERSRRAIAVVQDYLAGRDQTQKLREQARLFVISGLTDANGITAAYKSDLNQLYEIYDSILGQVSDGISVLGVRECQNSFGKKFAQLSPEGTDFLSSISELCVAAEFHRAGFHVEFEVEYGKIRPDRTEISDKDKKNPDFDIRASSAEDSLFIEVYNPFDQVSDGSPLLSENEIVNRIRRKALKQFGPDGSRLIDPVTSQPLFGHLFLAINLSYEGTVYVLDTAPQPKGGVPLNVQLFAELTHQLSKISALEGFLTFELPYPIEQKVLRMVNGKLYLLPSFHGEQQWMRNTHARFASHGVDIRIIDLKQSGD